MNVWYGCITCTQPTYNYVDVAQLVEQWSFCLTNKRNIGARSTRVINHRVVKLTWLRMDKHALQHPQGKYNFCVCYHTRRWVEVYAFGIQHMVEYEPYNTKLLSSKTLKLKP